MPKWLIFAGSFASCQDADTPKLSVLSNLQAFAHQSLPDSSGSADSPNVKRLQRLLPGCLAAVVLSGGCGTSMVARPSPFPGAPAAAIRSNHSGIVGPAVGSVIQTALGLRGVRYRLGGDEPAGGFDCSGLVRYVFEEHQLGMPRTVVEQYAIGRRVNRGDIRPGDLIFFSTTGRGATHVGIAIGPGEFVHAPGTGHVVRVERYDTPYWSGRLVGVRRAL